MSGTHAPRGKRAKRIELTLPASLGRVGLHSQRATLAASVLALALVASSTVALAVTGSDPTTRAKPAAAERSNAQTPVGDLIAGGNYPTPALSGDTGTAGVPPKTSPRPTKPVTGTGAVADGSQIATYAGGAGTLTPAGIATLAMAAGCSPGAATIATAVAMAESGGSPAAQGDTTLMDATWDWSAGLWQIRGLRSQRDTGALRDSVANQDPATNAAAMYSISSGCSNWGPWTTFTRGNYRAFLNIAGQAVRAVGKYRSQHGGKLPPVAPRDPNATVPTGGGGSTGGTDGAGTAAGRRSTTRSSASATPTRAPSGTSTPSSQPTRPRSGSSGGSTRGSGNKPTSTPTSTSSSKAPVTLPTTLPTLPTKLPSLKLPTKLPTLLPSL